jgi:hypothetical protein
LLVAGVIAVVAVIVIVVVTTGGGGSSSSLAKQPAVNWKTAAGVPVYGALGPEKVPVQLGTPLADPNTGLTGAPVDGVSCNSQEQTVYHHHTHLAIFINGQPRAVPLAIGFVPPAQVANTTGGKFAEGTSCLYWLHVHAQDGIVHIESPLVKTYLLAQFFGIWHQPLSSTQIGPNKGHVTATVNGKTWTGDPGQIPLNEDTQIVLNLGGPVVAPPPIVWSGTGL